VILTPRHPNGLKPGFCERVLLAGLTLLTGCQSSLSSNELRGPAVAARFTTNPLADTKFDRDYVPPPATVPSLKLGLNMQSGIDPVHSHFASNLGTVLMRELQLSSATLTVEPLVSLQPQAAVPRFPEQSTDGIISVAFTSPQDGLPPQLPPRHRRLSTRSWSFESLSTDRTTHFVQLWMSEFLTDSLRILSLQPRRHGRVRSTNQAERSTA
jgi:hypothetical protein